MMRTRLFALLLLLTVSYLYVHAQSVQQCLVTEYHGSNAKTPLAGVSVSAANAGASMSDQEGRLTLRFRSLKAGDKIQFRRIELNGYEVMNTEALEAARVSHLDTTALCIVMCRTEELAQLRDGYRTKAAQHYRQQMEAKRQQIEQLKRDGQLQLNEYNSHMDRLEEEYERQMSTLDTYVDKFARIDLSELDDTERQIVALVQEGRFDEAIARYDDMHLTERLAQGVKQQQQLTNDLQTIDSAIDAKHDEAERLEHGIDQQIELLQRVGGAENQEKIETLRKAKE